MDTIEQITIVGAGSMGHGIGQEFAASGYNVVLYDIDEKKLDSAMQRIRKNLTELSDWGVFPVTEIGSAMDRIHTTISIDDAVKKSDLVVEAIFENLELKQNIFRDLDRICSQHTILASNTSTLMPSSLASVTNRQDRVLVTHFYNPPYLMPLVEVARSELTSDKTVKKIYDLLVSIGKSPVILNKEILGFIATRLQIALFREAFYIVERGVATPQDVDMAVKTSFGRRLPVAGPFEMCEFNDGWDQIEDISNYVYSDLSSSSELSPVIKKMIQRKEFGVKSGKGFYDWSAENVENWRKRMATNLVGFLKTKAHNDTSYSGR